MDQPLSVTIVHTYESSDTQKTILTVGHRYLFKDAHVDGDVAYEATVEEISPSLHWVKLRHFPAGTYEWRGLDKIALFEELSALPPRVPGTDDVANLMQAIREGVEQGRAQYFKGLQERFVASNLTNKENVQ